MSEADRLAQAFKTTHWLVQKFGADMTHAESMQRPPFRANSFNWVLGHIVMSRHRVLALLDEPAVLSENELKPYETGADPAAEDATAVALATLLNAMHQTQARIERGLQAATPQTLAAVADVEREQTVAQRIAGLHWHETYHTGQLEILRQVSAAREPFP